MDFLDSRLSEYAEHFSSPESDVLRQLNRETFANVISPRMLSGHLQGRFLSMISHLVAPKVVLEIGTFTGYSAICLAEGLPENGMVHTIDINDELAEITGNYIRKSGFEKKIKLYFGDALQEIPKIAGIFDLVFIDADKENYSAYYDLVFDRVRPGGLLIADNVLWSGKVLEKESEMDKDTLAIYHFNQKIHRDSRIENVLLPVRDGLMIIRKK